MKSSKRIGRRLQLVREIEQDLELKEVPNFSEGLTTGNTGSDLWNEILSVGQDLPLDGD